MANVLGNLIVRLQAESTAFNRGITDAKDLCFTSSDAMVDSLRRVTAELGRMKFGNEAEWRRSASILGGVVAGIGIAAAGATVVVAKQVSEQASKMSSLAASYGLPVETLTQLRAAAALTDTPMEVLAAGMGRLSNAARAATQGHRDQVAAFKTLGVAFSDGNGHIRAMGPLVADVARKFHDMQDGTGKTAIAIQLLGRSGAAVIPFLNSLTQLEGLSEQLGLTWTEADVKAAEQFHQSLILLDLKTDALKENFVKGLMPAFDSVVSAFLTADVNGKSFARTVGEFIGEQVRLTAIDVHELYTEIRQLGVAFDFRKWGAEAQGEFDRLRRAHDEFIKSMHAPAPTLPTPGGKGGTSPTFAAFPKADVLAKEWASLLAEAERDLDRGDALKGQIDAIARLKERIADFQAAHPEKVFAQLAAEINRQLTARQALLQTESEIKEWQETVLPQIKAMHEQIAGLLAIPAPPPMASAGVIEQSKIIDLGKNRNEQQRLAGEIYERTRTSLERYRLEQERLNILVKKGAIDQDTFNRAMTQLNPLTAHIEHMRDAFNSTVAGIMSGAETLGQGARRIWQGMVASFTQAMLQIAEQWLVHLVTHKAFVATEQFTDAKLAASNTYAAVSSIPVVGPFLAPPAAAVAFAAVMAFDKGGIVPEDSLAMVHKREMVLPAELAQNMAAAFRTPSAGAGHLAFAGAGGNSYGPQSLTMHVNGGRDSADRVADAVMNRVQKYFRTGGVRNR